MADAKRLASARHAHIKQPDHRVPLRSVALIRRTGGWAYVWEQKHDIGFSALHRVNRAHDHLGWFTQSSGAAFDGIEAKQKEIAELSAALRR